MHQITELQSIKETFLGIYILSTYYGTFDCGDAHVGVVNTDTKLEDCIMYSSLKEAQNVQQFHKEYTQIRKVKVIDIGEV